MQEDQLVFCRNIYRTYFARFAFFRLLKKVLLLFYWEIRALRYRLSVISIARGIYRAYFAKYRNVRVLKDIFLLVLRKSDSIRFIILRMIRSRTFSLISMQDFKCQNNLIPFIYRPKEPLKIPGPRFVGSYPIDINGSVSAELKIPELEVIEIRKATVVGGTNFLLFKDQIIHPDYFSSKRDVSPIETFHAARCYPESGLMKLYLRACRKEISKAISLLGQCTGNYAHFLTETLPKLLIMDDIPIDKSLPILVDAWIHPVFFTMIDLFNVNNRPIIHVERWEQVAVSKIIDITPPAYVPPEYRELKFKGIIPESGYEEFPFSKHAMNMVRRAGHNAISATKCTKPGKRLYLKRSPKECGNARNIINIDDIEKLIKEYDFEVVEPGTLTFEEQISIFKKAEVIIAPVGAALANTIFTKPGCNIIALAPYYKNANYYYFSNLMGVLEHNLSYVLGPQTNMTGHPFHKNYYIDIEAFKKAMKIYC